MGRLRESIKEAVTKVTEKNAENVGTFCTAIDQRFEEVMGKQEDSAAQIGNLNQAFTAMQEDSAVQIGNLNQAFTAMQQDSAVQIGNLNQAFTAMREEQHSNSEAIRIIQRQLKANAEARQGRTKGKAAKANADARQGRTKGKAAKANNAVAGPSRRPQTRSCNPDLVRLP